MTARAQVHACTGSTAGAWSSNYKPLTNDQTTASATWARILLGGTREFHRNPCKNRIASCEKSRPNPRAFLPRPRGEQILVGLDRVPRRARLRAWGLGVIPAPQPSQPTRRAHRFVASSSLSHHAPACLLPLPHPQAAAAPASPAAAQAAAYPVRRDRLRRPAPASPRGGTCISLPLCSGEIMHLRRFVLPPFLGPPPASLEW